MNENPNKILFSTDEEFEQFYAQIVAEFGDTPAQEPELPREPAAVSQPAPVPNAYADRQHQAVPLKKDRSIRNLTILIVIELLGIAAVAAWWVLRLL